jgi:hypothetical protein
MRVEKIRTRAKECRKKIILGCKERKFKVALEILLLHRLVSAVLVMHVRNKADRKVYALPHSIMGRKQKQTGLEPINQISNYLWRDSDGGEEGGILEASK